MTVSITIDGKRIEVPDGSTVLDAANQLGISVPTMCYLKETGMITSCMVCVVKDVGRSALIPSCSARATDGMVIETHCAEVVAHRKSALELLLSEHGGDCEAPCRRACPAYMDIPEMLRLISVGDIGRAIAVVKEDIPLPGILGRICPAPCERVCRRKDVDLPVSICRLKQYVADADGCRHIPEISGETGKRVAVVGAGPAGLSAACFVRKSGHAVTVFEAKNHVGGSLRDDWAREFDLNAVIEAETEVVRKMGVELITGRQVSSAQLVGDYDAVILATGVGAGITVTPHTYETDQKGVFAIGSAVRPLKMAVMSVAHARAAAFAVDQYLLGEPIVGWNRRFDSRLGGKLEAEELQELMKGVKSEKGPELSHRTACSEADAVAESQRCMECDCLKKNECALRDYSGEYDCRQSAFEAIRPSVRKDTSHDSVVYEPGKCIKCGICVELSKTREACSGVGFVGRGVETRVAVPFQGQVVDAMKICGVECAEKCPTGALSVKRSIARQT